MFVGQVRLVPYAGYRMGGCAHPALGRRNMGQAIRCWGTQDGGTVCSDLKYHPPGCPTTPPVTETEVLPTPPEAATAVCGGGGVMVSPSAIPSATPTGAPSAEAPSAFPVVPVAIGSLAAAGLVAFLALR